MSESYDDCVFVREPDGLVETAFVVPGHAHPFDHTTWFIMGLWKVTCWDWNVSLDDWNPTPCITVTVQGGLPGARLFIKANRKHRLECIKGPGNYACVYPNRKEDGTIVPKYYGWPGAFCALDKPLEHGGKLMTFGGNPVKIVE